MEEQNNSLWSAFFDAFDSSILTAWMIVIAVVFLGSLILIFRFKNSGTAVCNRRTIELMPQIVSMIGVLGTFFGITIGLLAFQEDDLDKSIPELLGGLKTAFFTSLGGMLGSMILNAIINRLFDNIEKNQPSSTDEALGRVCQSIEAMSMKNAEVIATLQESIERQDFKNRQFQENLINKLSLLDKLTQLDKLEKLSAIDENLSDISANTLATSTEVQKNTTALNSISETVGDMKDSVDATVTTMEETKNKIQILADTMGTELENIGRMLQESNTKAMVEAMEKAAETFQEQMQEVVQRLVKENFEQLNLSVQRLNTWQMENKEMVAALTHQYAEMMDKFENTSTVLKSVSEYSQSLSGSAGLLARLVAELQKVMINDTKYTQIANKLTEAVELSRDGSAKFNNASVQLQAWIDKQKGFSESVNRLMLKLEELTSIRDYNQEFWQSTKQNLERGVNIVSGAIAGLNNEIAEIDEHFYDRLQSTLSNLDRCISEMLRHYNNRRI